MGLCGLHYHLQSVGESTLLARMATSASPWPPWSCINCWLSSRFARKATWASPWPPWSSTVSRRASCLHVWRPRLLLGLRDHVQIVGELPVCSYGDLGFSLATLIIYSQLESIPACTYGDLGFSLASVIMYKLSESSRFARMANWASPWPPWSSTVSRRASCLHIYGHLGFSLPLCTSTMSEIAPRLHDICKKPRASPWPLFRDHTYELYGYLCLARRRLCFAWETWFIYDVWSESTLLVTVMATLEFRTWPWSCPNCRSSLNLQGDGNAKVRLKFNIIKLLELVWENLGTNLLSKVTKYSYVRKRDVLNTVSYFLMPAT